MPAMPIGDPWSDLQWLLGVEANIRRHGPRTPLIVDGVDAYWADLARLLRMRALLRAKDGSAVTEEQGSMSSCVYAAFILGKGRHLPNGCVEPQPMLPGLDGAGAAIPKVSS